MNITVVGCGKIGTTILSNLVAEGHDVIGIDNNSEVIEQITNTYDAMGVCGNGTDCETLSEANVEHTELIVAATGSDELNMLICFIAKRMGAKHTIARIRNPEHSERSINFLRQQLDLSMIINPEMLAARELFNILKLPSAAKIETFSRRNFEIVELVLKPDSKLDGLSLIELRKRYKSNFLIGVVKRGDDVYIPDGNFVLHSGDKVGITVSPNEVQKLLKSMGIMQKQAKSVMILGASKTAFYLSKMLLNSGNSVKIIDKDRDRCHAVGDILNEAVVINGDGARQEILLEGGLRSADAFVALTGMDEQNILISYYATLQNVPKVITKVNRSEFAKMADRLGLDCRISPRYIVSDIVVRYARALQNSIGNNMETLYKLMDGKAEAIEFNISSDFPMLNIPLKEMKFRENTLIAGILRGRKAIIPSGDDVILAGDKIIAFAVGRRIADMSDIID